MAKCSQAGKVGCFPPQVLVKCWWGLLPSGCLLPKNAVQVFAGAPLGFVRSCGAVVPNPACSGHGYAVGQRWRFVSKETSLTMLLGKHAVPLTLSLGLGQDS